MPHIANYSKQMQSSRGGKRVLTAANRMQLMSSPGSGTGW